MTDYGKLETNELVGRYAQAAQRHGAATAEGNAPAANANADEIAAIYRELRSREKRAALLPLLDVDDPRITGWAAAHALEFAPEEGEPILTRMAEADDLAGFSAEVTLREWREGRLRFS